MRGGFRGRLLAWFGAILVPITAVLSYLAFTSASVASGFAEVRAVDDLAHAVAQVVQWTTDHSLTWRRESRDTAGTWAQGYREASKRLRLQAGRPATTGALDRLDRDFEAYWRVALEMADTYIKFDRVVGNSYTDRFHGHAKQVDEQVQALKVDVTQRMAATLRRATLFAVGGAVLVIAIFVGGALITAARLIGRIRPLIEAGRAIAAGDLTVRVAVTASDEIGELAGVINHTAKTLHDGMAKLAHAAVATAGASGRVSTASAQLASGAQEQASALERTAASLEKITATVRQSTDSALHASQLAKTSRDVAVRGGEIVAETVGSMQETTRAAGRIADIIAVIDEIAFQTNLLALNAAVEAARAGEQGRGFAVVAAEVRNLAQRSAVAAKEIKTLIRDSVSRVEHGAALVDRSGQTLTEIVAAAKQVAAIVAEIAAASQEQYTGIDQVNRVVGQVDQVTQRNAAQTESLAATAQALADQARELHTLVGRFRLAEETHGAVPTTTIAAPARVSPLQRSRAEQLAPPLVSAAR